ncbi:hypothetical protein B5M42_008585 [Paenibacillus athensensis]|uniref:Cysteine dioxygenase n=1 Tax=Paenibacillus athensensis TaxID=1967502 RepID=A0A4Y8Q9S7_9BACL|nr:hypothetical protein [Paenibacillus athensensis]MCD1258891.1 hypothetical protein [Paenibacillus athensensis]
MISMNDFMSRIVQTGALTDPSQQAKLCRFVQEHADLEQVLNWLDQIVTSSDEEQLQKLSTLMEVHPLGFEKYVIWNEQLDGPRMRLHYWPQNKWPFESIHDHRFHFCSTILCGSYTHETYEVKQTDGEQVELELTSSTIMCSGDVYYFPAGHFHRVLPSEELTLSLIIRSEAVLPYSRVIDPKTRILRNALGAKTKFCNKLRNLSVELQVKEQI